MAGKSGKIACLAKIPQKITVLAQTQTLAERAHVELSTIRDFEAGQSNANRQQFSRYSAGFRGRWGRTGVRP
jgi:hypothetical protein